MDPTLIAIIGAGVAIITAVGTVIVRDRQIQALIREGDDVLHARINDTRDHYVRRDDLDGHIRRIEQTVGEIKSELSQTNARLNEALQSNTRTLAEIAAMLRTSLAASPKVIT